MSNHKELDAYLAELCAAGLTYNAVFVPQSASRNSGEKNPSLNWRIALANAKGNRLDTDYMQGIGHVPGYCSRRDFYEPRELNKAQNGAAEHGKYPPVSTKTIAGKVYPCIAMGIYKRLPAPALRDVLYCLVQDAQGVDDCNGFEEWASNYGYDEDSRKAERIYQECKTTLYNLNRLLGAIARAKLAELFQEY